MKSFDSRKHILEVNSDDAYKILETEIKELKEKLEDKETFCAIVNVENEELVIKNESLSKEIVSLEDKLEDAFQECRNAKDTNDKVEEISHLRKTVEKVQCENKKLHEIQIDLEENVTMLENVVETRDLKIYSLEKKMRISEEETQCFTCKMCDVNIRKKSDLKKHIDECSDENLPSTSKCGTCDYQSDDDDDMRVHMKSKHDVLCKLCKYVCANEEDLKEHVNYIHEKLKDEEYNCVTCDMNL